MLQGKVLEGLGYHIYTAIAAAHKHKPPIWADHYTEDWVLSANLLLFDLPKTW
jgi:hypothetical protein